jgi:SNF2 family DNA or RNA helicase
MIYQRFDDHIKLEGKTEDLILLDGNIPRKTQSLGEAILSRFEISELIDYTSIGDIATYRKEIAVSKIKVVSDFVKNFKKDRSDSLIVYGIHTDFINGMHQELADEFKVEIINGQVPNKKRDEIEKRFQRGETQIIIANIHCMVGLNLTTGNVGIFGESSWTPKDNNQAISRLYRIGQKRKVLIYHLALANSLDEHVLNVILDKTKIINNLIS